MANAMDVYTVSYIHIEYSTFSATPLPTVTTSGTVALGSYWIGEEGADVPFPSLPWLD